MGESGGICHPRRFVLKLPAVQLAVLARGGTHTHTHTHTPKDVLAREAELSPRHELSFPIDMLAQVDEVTSNDVGMCQHRGPPKCTFPLSVPSNLTGSTPKAHARLAA